MQPAAAYKRATSGLIDGHRKAKRATCCVRVAGLEKNPRLRWWGAHPPPSEASCDWLHASKTAHLAVVRIYTHCWSGQQKSRVTSVVS